MPTSQDQVWLKMLKENPMELRQKAVIWRNQNAVTRVEKPSRIARARRLGYKAKQGIIVVRMRVGTGGMRKERPRAPMATTRSAVCSMPYMSMAMPGVASIEMPFTTNITPVILNNRLNFTAIFYEETFVSLNF